VVFFDSYASAMASSSLLETEASAEQYMKLSDGLPVFTTWTSSRTGLRRGTRSLTGHRPGLLPWGMAC
jgi:hypothetical protein